MNCERPFLTPPPSYDEGTSPFEWGGESSGAGLGAKERPFHWTGNCGRRSVPWVG